jgi:diaminohydroxyphosphoribosylaminopyrimidine deaminase/5-amino-6-(5-phosphoribosylamino)uracil reductase
MVGTQTARLDNPSLSVRHWYGKNPLRVVIDKTLSLDFSLHLFDGCTPTLVFTSAPPPPTPPNSAVEYIPINFQLNTELPLQITKALYGRNIQSLLVEGGSRLLQSFIDAGLWDEAFVEKSSLKLGSGVRSPEINHKHKFVVQSHFNVPYWHYIK